MPARFDWETEAPLESDAIAVAPVPGGGRMWRRWATVLTVAALMAALTAVWLGQTARAAEETVRAEVAAVHALMLQATDDGDAELYRSLLHEPDSLWFDMQERMLLAGLVRERIPLGLWAPVGGVTSTVTQISLSPELDRAELADRRPYVVWWPDGQAGTVWLRHVTHYRRVDGRWLQVPLPQNLTFWGPWQHETDTLLTLAFPRRDAEIARWLAPRLDEVAQRLCRLPTVDCPDDLDLEVRLSWEAGGLLRLAGQYSRLNLRLLPLPRLHLDLPAPSLVGLPEDDAGREALYRGYAAWLAVALLQRVGEQPLSAYEGPDGPLASLGLAPPPPASFRPESLAAGESLPLPVHDLQLLCPDPTAEGAAVWRYRLDADAWRRPALPPGLTPADLRRWGDAGDLLLSGRQSVDGLMRFRTWRWHGGRFDLLVDLPRHYGVADHVVAANTGGFRYLPLIETGSAGPNVRVRLFDLAECGAAGCREVPVNGLPTWSPDGRQAVIMQAGHWPARLHLADAAAAPRRYLGQGWSPFWTADDTPGFVRPITPTVAPELGRNRVEVVTVSTDGNAARDRVLLTSSDLISFTQHMPEVAGLGPELSFYVDAVYANPWLPGTLLVSAVAFDQDVVQFYFSLDPADGALRYLFQLSGGPSMAPSFAAGGRLVTVVSVHRASLGIYVYDQTSDQLRQFAAGFTANFRFPAMAYDWSADGQWLAVTEDRLLRVIHVPTGHEITRWHHLQGCQSVVWVDSQSATG